MENRRKYFLVGKIGALRSKARLFFHKVLGFTGMKAASCGEGIRTDKFELYKKSASELSDTINHLIMDFEKKNDVVCLIDKDKNLKVKIGLLIDWDKVM